MFRFISQTQSDILLFFFFCWKGVVNIMYTGSVPASASAILVYIQQASGTFASYLFFFF